MNAREDQRAEPDRARDAQDEQADRDAQGVDQGDHRGPAHEALDGVEGAAGHGLHRVRGAARRQQAQQPGGAVTMAEEEDEQQGQYGHGDRLAHHAHATDDVGRGRPPNLVSRSLAWAAAWRRGEVPAPKCWATDRAASLREAMIWSPVSMSAATTM